jgi:hydroxymethylbilane synthase
LRQRKIVIGSRDSKLAVAQTNLIIQQLRQVQPEICVELVTLKTTGDRILDKPLASIGGKGLFVKELDRALLEGKIDLAVHSLKDMPMEQNPELPIAAYSKRGDPRDALVLADGLREEDIRVIGTSSPRRRVQLEKLFPSAAVESVRGNLQTRFAKLDGGGYSALILAAAGLERMGLSGRAHRIFSVEEMLPAAGQGILAVQCRRDFDCSLLEGINDAASEAAALAERSFVAALGGGCTAPVAAYAKLDGTMLHLAGLYADEDGSLRRGTVTGTAAEAQECGFRLAKQLQEADG